MHTLRVKDIMSAPVWSVRATTSVKALARLLAEHRISGVPVVAADDRVIGVVSEADLLRVHSMAGLRGWRSKLVRWFTGERPHGTVAAIMSTPAVTTRPEVSVNEAARQLTRHFVKRLPVIDRSDRLMGIITRADLVRAFARTDEELYAEIVHRVLAQDLCIPVGAGGVAVSLADGVVTLTGVVEQRSLKGIAAALISQIAGVTEVRDEVEYTVDDTRLPAPEPSNVGIMHRRSRMT